MPYFINPHRFAGGGGFLEDNFDDNSLNTTLWSAQDYFGDMGATVSEQNQRLEILLTANTTGYGGIYSQRTDLNFVDKTLTVFYGTHFPDTTGFGGDEMWIYEDADNYVLCGNGGGGWLCRVRNAGVNTDVFGNSSNMQMADRWRIVHDSAAGKIKFYYWNGSLYALHDNGGTGTTISWTPSSIQVRIDGGYWGTGGSFTGPITLLQVESDIAL